MSRKKSWRWHLQDARAVLKLFFAFEDGFKHPDNEVVNWAFCFFCDVFEFVKDCTDYFSNFVRHLGPPFFAIWCFFACQPAMVESVAMTDKSILPSNPSCSA